MAILHFKEREKVGRESKGRVDSSQIESRQKGQVEEKNFNFQRKNSEN